MALLDKDYVFEHGINDFRRLNFNRKHSYKNILPQIRQDEDFQLGLKYGYLLAIYDYEEDSYLKELTNLFLATLQSFEYRLSKVEDKQILEGEKE